MAKALFLKVNAGTYTFTLIWLGQLVSLFGSGLSSFALSIWVFENTGSTLEFTLTLFFRVLPGVIISPVAGVLVDRIDRRLIMILSDLGAGLATACYMFLLLTDQLQLWHIYAGAVVVSICAAFQWPAYFATITLLVPQKHFGRASGLVQMADAAAGISTPVIAGILLRLMSIEWIFLIDLATFIFALVVLLGLKFPKIYHTTKSETSDHTFFREVLFGWRYILDRPGLLALLLFFGAALNFVSGSFNVLVTPLILGLTSADVLSFVLAAGAVGTLAGATVMAAWGGTKRRIDGMIFSQAIIGVCLLLGGLFSSTEVIAIVAFGISFCIPIISGSAHAIWQAKTPPDIQGRLFATRRMIAWSSLPLAYILSGTFIDYVFEPLVVSDTQLAQVIQQVIGNQAGGAISIFYVVLGILNLLTLAVAYVYPRLRLVEEDLPDIIIDDSQKV